MNRYQQHIRLPEIGIQGQAKITASRVAVIGAGGLGTVVAGYLSAMGVGHIAIVDFDVVEETNLHRQFLYSPSDIGQKKAIVLREKLHTQNDTIEIKAITEKFSPSNAIKILTGYGVVCDCTDDLHTRIELDKHCSLLTTPLVHGAVSEWQGYLTVFHHTKKYSYRDVFEYQSLLDAQTCTMNGISSPICGIIGSYMANETIKLIVGISTVLDGRLWYVNGLNNVSRLIRMHKVF